MAIELLLSILINHLWQSLLFVGAIWGLCRLLRRNSPRLRYFLWLSASLKFLVPFMALAALAAQIPSVGVGADPASAGEPVAMAIAAKAVAPMQAVLPYPTSGQSSGGYVTDVVLTLGTLAVWLLGSLFMASRWLLRWLEIRRVLRRSVPLVHLDFPVPVHSTQEQIEPGVVGVFRQRLLLPAGIEERLTAEQMHAVLAHERCHLRWRDNLTASLHMIAETLFWFFPPVWWIGRKLIAEREAACDEQVVREGHVPEKYAEAILNVCEHYIASRLLCVSGVSGADLRLRVQSIVRRTLALKLDRPRKLMLATATCVALAAPVAAGMMAASPLQVLLSLKPGSAAMIQYWGLSSARVAASTVSCPAPGAEFVRQQKVMAANVARLSPRDDRALLYAIAANAKPEVRRLLAGKAPLQGDGLLRSSSLMHIAAEFGDVEMLQILASAGIALDGLSTDGIGRGHTPLMVAISRGQPDNARWLMTQGVDLNLANKWDTDALITAMAACRDHELVASLLQAGARPSARALRIASKMGFDLSTDSAQPPSALKDLRPGAADASIALDLDGDRIPDQVQRRLSPDGTHDQLSVKLSRRLATWIEAVDFGSPRPLLFKQGQAPGVVPGTQATACSNEHTPACRSVEFRAITLQQPGTWYAQPEDAESIIYWDHGAQEHRRARFAD